MKADKYIWSVIEELKQAQNNGQVERTISVAIAGIEQTEAGMTRSFILQMQSWLESLSPLDWNSTQWGCFRYAGMYLRKYSMMEPV